MFRRCYEYMFDELDIQNSNLPRWIPTPNSVCYTLPDHSRASRASRCEYFSIDYPRQQYWLPQNWVLPGPESWCFSRRSDKRSHQPKSFHFSREKRSHAEQRCFEHRFEKDDGNIRFERGKRCPPRFERRLHSNWNKDFHHSAGHEERNPSRPSHRGTSFDLCADDFFASHRAENLKEVYGTDNASAEFSLMHPSEGCAHKNATGNSVHRGSASLGNRESSETKWKHQGVKGSSRDCLGRESPTNFASSYDSWYCPQEQQQIIDTLKEVNLRHDRQLRRDMIGPRAQCSDESASSNIDPNCLEYFQRSVSSEDDEDTINILLSPGDAMSTLEETNEEEELKPCYLDKSASEIFEEFQSIFTGSPERQMFNDLTKETLNKQANSEDKIVRRRISVEDKNAVKSALKFEDIDEEAHTFCGITNAMSSSPKETISAKSSDLSPGHMRVGTPCLCSFNSGENAFQSETGPESPKEKSADLDRHCHISQMGDREISRTQSMEKQFQNDSRSSHSISACSFEKVPHENNSQMPDRGLNVHESQVWDSRGKYSPEASKIRFAKLSSQENVWKTASERLVDNIAPNPAEGKLHNKKNTLIDIPAEGSLCKLVPKCSSSTNSKIQDVFDKSAKGKMLRKNTSNIEMPLGVPSGGKVSCSEPFLDSGGGETVYRRISVSEIFNSVNIESEKNKQILKQRQSYINKMVRQTQPEVFMSPSSHLKLILGIGVEKSNESKSNVQKQSRFEENGTVESPKASFLVPNKTTCNLTKQSTEGSVNTNSSRCHGTFGRHPRCSSISNEENKHEKPDSVQFSDCFTDNTENKISQRNHQKPKSQKCSVESPLKGFSEQITESPTIETKDKCLKTMIEPTGAMKPAYPSKNGGKWPSYNCLSHEGKLYAKSNKKNSRIKNERSRNDFESDRFRKNINIQNFRNYKESPRRQCESSSKIESPVDGASEVPFQNRQQSSKPKRIFKHGKKQSNYSESYNQGYVEVEGTGGENYLKESLRNQEKRQFTDKQHAISEAPSSMQNGNQNTYQTKDENDMKGKKYNARSKSKNEEAKEDEFKLKNKPRSSERSFLEEDYCNSKNSDFSNGPIKSLPRDWQNKEKTWKPSEAQSEDHNCARCSCFETNVKSCVRTGDTDNSGHLEDETSNGKEAQGARARSFAIKNKPFEENQTGTNPKNKGNSCRLRSSVSGCTVSRDIIKDLLATHRSSPNAGQLLSAALGHRVQRLVVETEKASHVIKMWKLSFKKHRKKGDRLKIKYCLAKPASTPSPFNQLFMDHVLGQKLHISVFGLPTNNVTVPLVVVSSLEDGKDGKTLHLLVRVESIRDINNADGQLKCAKNEKMNKRSSLNNILSQMFNSLGLRVNNGVVHLEWTNASQSSIDVDLN